MHDTRFERYDLLTRGSRRTHESFNNISDLKSAVRALLSPSELRTGVLERLTSFDPRRADANGVATLKYQNIETWATLAD